MTSGWIEALDAIAKLGSGVAAVVGAAVAFWSFVRTRKRYYDEYVKGREKRP